MRVSVVIPAYNAAHYLAESIESVLAQTYPAAEVIVVDDGSTDTSEEVAARYPVRVVRVPHGGLGAARNAGVAISNGELLAFLDADDLWMPDKTERQVACLQVSPQLDMVFGLVRHFYSPELTDVERAAVACPDTDGPGRSACAMLVRRAAFDRVGPFATGWSVGEFVDWFCRAQEAGLQSASVPTVVFRRRVHRANMTLQRSPQDYVRILGASLQRRRRP